MKRREFLQRAGATVLTGAAIARGADEPKDPLYDQQQPTDYDRYDFIFARVRFVEQGRKGQGKGPDLWNVRPGGDANLLREFSRVIQCRVKPIHGAFDWNPQYAREGQLNAVVRFDEPDHLRQYPFLFMTGENYFVFSEQQKRNLKEYITAGGFILMDDCVVGSGGDFFYRSSFALLEEIFGTGSVRVVPRDHEIFNNVYDFSQTGLPSLEYAARPGIRRQSVPHGQNHGARGVFIGDRLAVFLSSTDLHCGWCDSHGVEWGIEGYRRTIQMGINVILYAMTH